MPLSYNDAPTDEGDYRLLPGSSATGSGNNNQVDSWNITGLIKLQRIFGQNVDQGAYENLNSCQPTRGEDVMTGFKGNHIPG